MYRLTRICTLSILLFIFTTQSAAAQPGALERGSAAAGTTQEDYDGYYVGELYGVGAPQGDVDGAGSAGNIQFGTYVGMPQDGAGAAQAAGGSAYASPFRPTVVEQTGRDVSVRVSADNFASAGGQAYGTISWGDGTSDTVTFGQSSGGFWQNALGALADVFGGSYAASDASDVTVQHTYNQHGSYTISATDENDDQAPPVNVLVGGGAYLSAHPNDGTAPVVVRFETTYGDPEGTRPSYEGAPDTILLFGDGEEAWLECPDQNDTDGTCPSHPISIEHRYTAPGTYVAQVVRAGRPCINTMDCSTTIIDSTVITVTRPNAFTNFFGRIASALRSGFNSVVSVLLPGREDEVSDRDFAELPDINDNETRHGAKSVSEIDAIIINTGGADQKPCVYDEFPFQAYVLPIAPPDIAIEACSLGEDVTDYLGTIADRLHTYHGFTEMTVDELLALPVYLGNAHKQLNTNRPQPRDERAPVNELALEVKATDANGTTVIDWTTQNVTIADTDQIAFRWNVSDYQQCLVFLGDQGNYSLTRPGIALTSGNTETEEYNVPEYNGVYRIQCREADNNGIAHGIIRVTIGTSEERGTDDDTYTINDVASVQARNVDPIPEAVDDEYTEYTITLNDGTVHVVKRFGFGTNQDQNFYATGFQGSVSELIALGTKPTITDIVLHDASDIASIVSRYVDPEPMMADEEYTEYTVTLLGNTVYTVTASAFQPQEAYREGLLADLRANGYTGTLEEFEAFVPTIKSPMAQLEFSSTGNVAPLSVTFTATYYGDASLAFGDGTSAARLPTCVNVEPCTETVTHVYEKTGTFTAKLVAGCPSTQGGGTCDGVATSAIETVSVVSSAYPPADQTNGTGAVDDFGSSSGGDSGWWDWGSPSGWGGRIYGAAQDFFGFGGSSGASNSPAYGGSYDWAEPATEAGEYGGSGSSYSR